MSSTSVVQVACVLTAVWCATATVTTAGGRPDVAPETIRIGLVEPAGPQATELFAGASAAVEKLNAAGGVAGHPVRLVALGSAQPWRDGAAQLARLAFEERLSAMIGPTDGSSAHVAAQIATMRRIPIITLSPEESVTQARDPWIFRGVPSDHVQARALLDWAFAGRDGATAIAAVPDGRQGRERLDSLRRACRDAGVELLGVIRIRDGDPVQGLASLPAADVLMLWLDPVPALALLHGSGPERLPEVIIASTRLDDRKFRTEAPAWPESLVVPLLGDDTDTTALRDRLGQHMIGAIAQAVREAGPEPGRIRVGLAGLSQIVGASGSFDFDKWGNRRGELPVGEIRGGPLMLARPSGGPFNAVPRGPAAPAGTAPRQP